MKAACQLGGLGPSAELPGAPLHRVPCPPQIPQLCPAQESSFTRTNSACNYQDEGWCFGRPFPNGPIAVCLLQSSRSDAISQCEVMQANALA